MRNLWGGRRSATWMAGVAGAVVLLVGTSGCAAESAPAPTSSASSSPTPAAPVFASDEEALAAATEAYANYLAVHDSTWADGDGSVDDFLALTVGDAHDADKSSFDDWTAKGWRSVGTTTFDSMNLQAISQTRSGVWQVQTYLCLDGSAGDVVDSSGMSVAPADRPLRLPLEVWFVTASPSSPELKISESNVWPGKNFC